MSITYQSSKFDPKFEKKSFRYWGVPQQKKFFFEKIVFVLCQKLTGQFCSEFNADPHHVDFFLKNIGGMKNDRTATNNLMAFHIYFSKTLAARSV